MIGKVIKMSVLPPIPGPPGMRTQEPDPNLRSEREVTKAMEIEGQNHRTRVVCLMFAFIAFCLMVVCSMSIFFN